MPLYLRDSEDEQQVPDDLVTLQIYRCKRQLSSTSWEETMASQRGVFNTQMVWHHDRRNGVICSWTTTCT